MSDRSVQQEALRALISDLYRSTESLADGLGVSVACRSTSAIGCGEAHHHLALLDRLCEQLHLQSSAVAHATPANRAAIRLEAPNQRTPHV